ncbi:MAG: transcriptional regulator [Candidatus Thorarchaeota archaeon]|nr:transcriptional regulator [Candidatus Thorarchaeota archaeon]
MTRDRTQLLEEAENRLVEAGFTISTRCDIRPSCFDLVARRGDQIVLVKVLANIDAMTEEDAKALGIVAAFFNATPLVVGLRTRRSPLEEGLVYRRYGVTAITPALIASEVSEDKRPRSFVQRGGRFVEIDGAELRRAREVRGMTQEQLADCVQVSARAILAYEREEMDVSTEVAEQLETVLETDLIIPIDVFRKSDTKGLTQRNLPEIPENVSYLEKRVRDFFERLGMKVLWTDRAPFDLAAKEKGPPLMSSVGSIRNPGLQKRVEIIKSVSKVTESEAVVIIEEGKADENIADIPVIRQLELDEIDKPQELRRIIAERSDG